MADLVLLGAAVGLTIQISRHVHVESKINSVKVALGLSLGLISLTIVETLPPSLLAVFGHDTHDSWSYLTITTAYKLLLWILSLLVVVVLPAAAGARLVQLFERRRSVDIDERKYHSKHMRYIARGIHIVVMIPIIFIKVVVTTLLRRFSGRKRTEPVLVMSSSLEGSRHGPVSPSTRNSKGLKWKSATIGGLFGIVIVVVLLWSLGSLIIRVQSPTSSHTLLPTMVSWMCAVGLLLSSVLNGFGSVSLPHSCLVGLYLEPIGPEVIARAQVELEKASAALSEKRNEFTLTLTSSSSSDLQSMKRRTWGGGSTPTNTQKVQREVEFLESLCDELTEEIADMKHAKMLGEQARTPMGKIRFYLGFVFSLVLLVRLGTSFASIWNASNNVAPQRRTDPITTALVWITGHHLVSVDYNALSQFVSLVLTAFLSVSQVRYFIRTLSALNRRLMAFYRKCQCNKSSRKQINKASQESQQQQSYADLLAALMGCYFLSCIVMTKRILPIEYRASFSKAMGDSEFVVQSAVEHSTYCTSAIVSAIVLGMLFGIQRQNTKRTVMDETIGNGSSGDAC